MKAWIVRDKNDCCGAEVVFAETRGKARSLALCTDCCDSAVDLLCKVGNKVYQTDGVKIYESTINEITLTSNKMIFVTENIAFDETAIGKSIFLSKQEVEAKMKGGE